MGNKIKGKCDGLTEGCEYQFRIRAVNKGGPSKPGPPSESMIAKHRFIPPHIIGDGIHDLTLKKGRPIRYDLWFGGEPAPSVEWLRNGRTLGSDENTSLELYSKNTIYTERNTVLSIPKVSCESETYHILLSIFSFLCQHEYTCLNFFSSPLPLNSLSLSTALSIVTSCYS